MQAYLPLIVAGFFVFNTLAGAAARKVYVTNAIDGDVLELLDNGKQYRARIAGIDAPAKDSDRAKAAKLALSSLTFGRWAQASCENAPAPPPKKPGDKAKPGPLYCRVEIEGLDLAVAQLEAGNARYSPKQVVGVDAEHQKRYQQAELKAKDAKLGVWGN